jgi:hypothetical protein
MATWPESATATPERPSLWDRVALGSHPRLARPGAGDLSRSRRASTPGVRSALYREARFVPMNAHGLRRTRATLVIERQQKQRPPYADALHRT